jgi:hypothetical protein
MAMNMVVLDDEYGYSSYIFGIKNPISVSDQAGGFSFGHKKALHLHVRLIVFLG